MSVLSVSSTHSSSFPFSTFQGSSLSFLHVSHCSLVPAHSSFHSPPYGHTSLHPLFPFPSLSLSFTYFVYSTSVNRFLFDLLSAATPARACIFTALVVLLLLCTRGGCCRLSVVFPLLPLLLSSSKNFYPLCRRPFPLVPPTFWRLIFTSPPSSVSLARMCVYLALCPKVVPLPPFTSFFPLPLLLLRADVPYPQTCHHQQDGTTISYVINFANGSRFSSPRISMPSSYSSHDLAFWVGGGERKSMPRPPLDDAAIHLIPLKALHPPLGGPSRLLYSDL